MSYSSPFLASPTASIDLSPQTRAEEPPCGGARAEQAGQCIVVGSQEQASGRTPPPRGEGRILRAVERFQRGEAREDCFEIIAERYYGPVVGFFGRRAVIHEERLDLTHETFVRIYHGLKSFRGSGRLDTWVFRIAHNVYLRWSQNQRRAARPAPTSDTDIERLANDSEEIRHAGASSQEAPLAGLLRREAHEQLRQAIETLPDQMRRCIILRLYRELSYEEIATVMKLATNTVKVHLHQARKKLKTQMEGSYAQQLDDLL